MKKNNIIEKKYLNVAQEVLIISNRLNENKQQQKKVFENLKLIIREELEKLEVETNFVNNPQKLIDVITNPTDKIKDALLTLYALIPIITKRELSMFHYPVQIAAGMALVDGNIIQLQTGEGKTIVGLYPEITFGLLSQIDRQVCDQYKQQANNNSVHVITANPFLAERDMLWLSPVISWFGLTVAQLNHHDNLLEIISTYETDIIFGTSSDFIFTYLRSQLANKSQHRLNTTPFVLLVDEIDHALIDEARTPFIISKDSDKHDDSQFRQIKLIHHIEPLAKQLASEPMMLSISSHPEFHIGLTGNGKQALNALFDNLYKKPNKVDQYGFGENSEAMSYIPLINIYLLLVAEAGGITPSNSPPLITNDGEPSDYFIKRLKSAFDESLKETNISTPKELLKIIKDLGKGRKIFDQIIADLQLTPSDLKRMTKTLLKKINITKILFKPSASLDLFIDLIWPLIKNQITLICQIQTQPDDYFRYRLAQHIDNIMIILKRFIPIEKLTIELVNIDKAISTILKRESNSNPNPNSNFADDIQYYWLNPFSVAIDNITDSTIKDVYLFIQIYFSFTLKFSYKDKLTNRYEREAYRMSQDIGRMLNHPTLFITDPENKKVQLQIFGRYIVRKNVNTLLRHDLWPHINWDDIKDDPEVLLHIYSKAESLTELAIEQYIFKLKDTDYIVEYNSDTFSKEIIIIDELTGHPLRGRRWSNWIHPFLEKKENLLVKPDSITQNKITIQLFAKRYPHVCGMSGTAKEADNEFLEIYGRNTCVFHPNIDKLYYLWNGPTNQKPLKTPLNPIFIINSFDKQSIHECIHSFKEKIRQIENENTSKPVTILSKDEKIIKKIIKILSKQNFVPKKKLKTGDICNHVTLPDAVFLDDEAKEKDIISDIKHCHEIGMPILLVTASVKESVKYYNILTKLYSKEQVQVLNALKENYYREAEVISRAERKNIITIVTQMGGRGVDIVLQKDAQETGGLFVIGTERRDSRRWDNQIAGRTARQGDLGYCIFFLSLNDSIPRLCGSDRIIPLMEKLMGENDYVQSKIYNRSIENAQKRLERKYANERKRSGQIDGFIDKFRKDIFYIRDQTFKESSQHSGEWCRPYVRKFIVAALKDAIRPISIEEDLAKRFADQDDLPVQWDWESLVNELNKSLNVPITKDDIAINRRWKDKKLRQLRKVQPHASFWKRPWIDQSIYLLKMSDENERNRLVNLSEIWNVTIEYKILKNRIKELIQLDSRKMVYQNIEVALSKVPDYSDVDYAVDTIKKNITELYNNEPVEDLIYVLFPENHKINVTSKNEMLQYCDNRLQIYFEDKIIDVQDVNQYALHRLNQLMLPLQCYIQQQSQNAEYVSTKKLLRCTQEKIKEWYRNKKDELGKVRMYWEENSLLRQHIDKYYSLFLNDTELQISRLNYDFHEDKSRGYCCVIQNNYDEMKSNIGEELIRTWPTMKKSSKQIDKTQKKVDSPYLKPIIDEIVSQFSIQG